MCSSIIHSGADTGTGNTDLADFCYTIETLPRDTTLDPEPETATSEDKTETQQ